VTRDHNRIAAGILAGLLAVAVVIVDASVAFAATGGWTIARSPGSVVTGVSTRIDLTATNTAGGSSVGCVHLQAPAAFTVDSVGFDSAPGGLNWTVDAPTAGPSGSTIISVHAVTEGDILKTDGDAAQFHISVTGGAVGTYTWAADSRDHANCTSGIDSASISVSITGASPTPTPTPKPTPTASPTAKPTSTPSATPTPTPTATPSAAPTATPTPTPAATATPRGTPSATPTGSTTPSASAGSPSPSALASGIPLATDTPEASMAADPSNGVGPQSSGVIGSVTGGGSYPPAGPSSEGLYSVGLNTSDGGELSLTTATLASLDGIVWAVPGLALVVPGLLLVIVVLAQVVAGAAWLPIVRRKLGSPRVAPPDPH
jgi:hypothetical protein